MISLFQIAPDDQSVVYLGQIFGVISNVLMPDSASMLLGVLFKVLNTSMLTLGAGIVIYTTIVGLLKTAQEGEFLGKQWNSLWVPLRTVFGIAALFPLPGGYSAIQVIFMWIIMQGVGAADTLWSTVINYNIIVGSPTAPQTSMGDVGLDGKLATLFQSAVCQAEAHRNSKDLFPTTFPTPTSYFCHAYKTDTFCANPLADPQTAISDDQTKNVYSMGPETDGCGKLTYCLENSATNDGSGACDTNNKKSAFACTVCQAQKQALKQIIPVITGIAEKVVDTDDDYVRTRAYYQYGGSKGVAGLVQIVSSGSSQFDTPQWISNYCSDMDKSDISDCVLNGPLPYDGSSNNLDRFNTSKEAVKNLYFPYSITPFMTGNTSGSSSSNAVNFIQAVNKLYSSTLSAAVTSLQDRIINVPSTSGQTWQVDAKRQGWIFAGGYFYKIISESKQNIDAGLPQLTVEGERDSSNIKNYRNNYNAAAYLLSEVRAAAIQKNSSNQPLAAVSSKFGDTSAAWGSAASNIVDLWMKCLNTDQNQAGSGWALTGKASKTTNNPLLSMATFGYQLMIIAQVLFASLVALTVITVALLTFNPIYMGNGLTSTPWGEAFKAMVGMVSPLVILLIGTMYSLGAILGIYVPLVPFMIFSMGAIGWMLATVEAMVAAPVVALGILSPGGQSEILGRAEPAMMLMLNLFLRPSLMVVGLMASTLVSIPAIKLVNTTFLATIHVMMTDPGLFEEMLLISFYSSFVVTVINKCYSLTYVIPERVLTWIGGQAVQYGEQEALQASKQAIEGSAQANVGAGKEVSGHASQTGAMLGQTKAGVKAKIKAKEDRDNQG